MADVSVRADAESSDADTAVIADSSKDKPIRVTRRATPENEISCRRPSDRHSCEISRDD